MESLGQQNHVVSLKSCALIKNSSLGTFLRIDLGVYSTPNVQKRIFHILVVGIVHPLTHIKENYTKEKNNSVSGLSRYLRKVVIPSDEISWGECYTF